MAGLLDSYNRLASSPAPQPVQRPALAPPTQPGGGLIQPPEDSPFWHGYRSTVWGPAAAEMQRQREMAPWRQAVITKLSRELLEGRPQDRPISVAELRGALHEIAPQMLNDDYGMKQLGTWIGMWNKEAAAVAKARSENWDRQAGVAKNLFDSGKDLGAGLTQQQRQFLGRFGYASRDQAGLASAPGAGMVPWQEPITPPVTTLKRGGKERVFAGYIPGAAQRESEKIRVTTPAEATRAGAITKAQQKAALPFAAARAGAVTKAQQEAALPFAAARAGAVADAQQKAAFPYWMQKQQWKQENPDPRQQENDLLGKVERLTQLSQLRLKVGQYGTDNPEMAANMASLGFRFNQADPQAKERALQAMDREIAILKSKLPADWFLEGQQPQPAPAPPAQPPRAQAPMLQMKQPPQAGKSPFPQYPDAEQGADGNWYVVRDGRKYRVVP